jgi:NAD(P)-dependent dehydrogenase (short-subunit alcohol dehydrogenase family)
VATIDWTERPVALVTGAAARALARRGARVAVLDVDAERGGAIAEEIGGTFVALDVSSAADWNRAVARIHAELGAIEIAHLNAGVMTLAPNADFDAAMNLAAIPDAAYRRIVAVNVDGVFLGIRAVVPEMEKRERGVIVVTASIGGLTAVPFDPLYAMTKHAIVGLVRSAAPALAAHGIALSAICPGGVDTALVPDYVRALDPPLLAPLEVGRAVVALVDAAPDAGIFVVRPGRPDPEAFPAPTIELA